MIPADVPLMPRGVRLQYCDRRKQWFLLAPELALGLDAVAPAVLSRVDGQASAGAISADLVTVYNAPRERIEADVVALLQDLVERRILDLADAPDAPVEPRDDG